MTPSRQYALISNALDGARDYFARRAHVEEEGPNQELFLCTEIEQAQAALEELRKIAAPAYVDPR